MTVSTTNTDFTAPANSGVWASVTNFFTGLGNGYRAYRTFNELNRLNDRQLADIGLTRSDVPRAAAKEIFKV